MPKSKIPTIAIIGRPNVGKSTLFNRFLGKQEAVVDSHPGVSRDRKYGLFEWLGHNFNLIDTGGMKGEGGLALKIDEQAGLAIEEGDLLIFVVDGKEELTSSDHEVAQLLRKSKKPVLLAVNKIDRMEKGTDLATSDFYSLGLSEPVPISAIHGLNIDRLLDEVIERSPFLDDGREQEEEGIRVAIVGRPNVGKSSLLNRILGKERVIVDEVSGTTRDAIDTPFCRGEKRFVFIDTAGIRKKAKVSFGPELYSISRAIKSIKRAHVSLLVIDALEGVADQEKRIASKIEDAGSSGIVVVNKWDLVEDEEGLKERFVRYIKSKLAPTTYFPILFASALKGKGINELIDLVEEMAGIHQSLLPTGPLNRAVERALVKSSPPSVKGKSLKIYYVTQTRTEPPTFLFFVNHGRFLKPNYRRYLQAKLREEFDLRGTPLRLLFRQKRK
ncbi:ribosome biogenesis GTPase Der [bacterium]|nr:ribosome biogenesis GTPase Der [bacterium]